MTGSSSGTLQIIRSCGRYRAMSSFTSNFSSSRCYSTGMWAATAPLLVSISSRKATKFSFAYNICKSPINCIHSDSEDARSPYIPAARVQLVKP